MHLQLITHCSYLCQKVWTPSSISLSGKESPFWKTKKTAIRKNYFWKIHKSISLYHCGCEFIYNQSSLFQNHECILLYRCFNSKPYMKKGIIETIFLNQWFQILEFSYCEFRWTGNFATDFTTTVTNLSKHFRRLNSLSYITLRRFYKKHITKARSLLRRLIQSQYQMLF